ncbi:MAG: hypothetical protein OEZ01_10210 [Candidatus Heimdallarchaeota archaeon]|nr:hypothetical protein [Candidatus Heimdallarchaeota archaeon]MDH5646372.1 hypothetical protein [Candidatus Heimdallarchaeota archaeon]
MVNSLEFDLNNHITTKDKYEVKFSGSLTFEGTSSNDLILGLLNDVIHSKVSEKTLLETLDLVNTDKTSNIEDSLKDKFSSKGYSLKSLNIRTIEAVEKQEIQEISIDRDLENQNLKKKGFLSKIFRR